MMIRSLTALLVLLFLSTDIGYTQEPTYLGSIPSDTINSLFGTSILPLGDQNDDGCADVLVWDYRQVAQLFLGGESVDLNPFVRINNIQITWSTVGDVNSDNHDDIAVPFAGSSEARLDLLYGGPSIDSTVDRRLGVDSLNSGYLRAIRGTDIDGNGSEEIITQNSQFFDARIVFYDLLPTGDSVPDLVFGPGPALQPFLLFGERICVGDFNGDGDPDLAASWRSSSNSERGAAVLYWGGLLWDTVPDLIISRPGGYISGSENFAREVLCSPGDLNGDGVDDLVVGSSHSRDDTLTFVFFGGPTIDTMPDVTIYQEIDLVSPGGDINNDGYVDIVTSYVGEGLVSLYYGGPDFDGLCDFRIRKSDLPGLHFEFGMFCTGIGDYNGDGIDDFAFSGVNVQSGTVYIYAGFDGSTGNGGGGDGDVLPVDYELVQNYPNPFNPTTTISFTLPQKASVELTVYNVLGRKVSTLLSKDLPAGTHTVGWNGTDSHGEAVSSGVYFYRLTAGEAVLSRKMVLAR
ncbi:T9SS type A sorting domain-containing protein [candidate division GN15 bacterium]|nr:T9SS type A sorting domain-containing protein [candidate division GN15 bacterium]